MVKLTTSKKQKWGGIFLESDEKKLRQATPQAQTHYKNTIQMKQPHLQFLHPKRAETSDDDEEKLKQANQNSRSKQTQNTEMSQPSLYSKKNQNKDVEN
jgi:hypothetical protein